MDSSQLRALFERLVFQVVIESSSVSLQECIVPAQYEPEDGRLVISDNLSDGDMIRASIAALLHHVHRNKVGATLFACRDVATREYRHMTDGDICFVKKFIEDKTLQQRFLF